VLVFVLVAVATRGRPVGHTTNASGAG
jgi:hypothetical protein